MEYHYQWPKYRDLSLSEGRGWESLCLSPPPPLYPDTPTMSACAARAFPRGRPMRRRRLFPPPYNRFPRDARQQWSVPCYDHRCQWNPQPQAVNACPQFDHECPSDNVSADNTAQTPTKTVQRSKSISAQLTPTRIPRDPRPQWSDPCYDHRCQWNPEAQAVNACSPQFDHKYPLDKGSTDNTSHTPTKTVQRGKRLSRQLTPTHGIRNGDQSICGSNRAELLENVHQKEWNSPSRPAPIGHESLVSFADNVFGYESLGFQESPKSTFIPVINGESGKIEFNQNGFTSSYRTSIDGSERCGVDGGKEDQLALILNQTIFGASDDVTSNCQYVSDSIINQLDEESVKLSHGYNLSSKPSNSCQNVTDGNSELLYSSRNNSKIPYGDALFYSGSIGNFSREFSEEPETAAFNQHPELDSQEPTSCDNDLLFSKPENFCSQVKTNNSLVLYDPPSLKQSVDENIIVESENNLNTSEVNTPSNTQFSKDINSYLCSSETENSISSLSEKNQLLEDLLSQLISGNLELLKDLDADNQLLVEPENSSCQETVQIMEASIPENFSLQKVSVEDPMYAFEDFATNVNLFPEISLPPSLDQETGGSSFSNEQLTHLKADDALKNPPNRYNSSSKLIPMTTVTESTKNCNSLVAQAQDLAISAEKFSSNTDFLNSDSESNIIEATISSLSNYIFEEPLKDLSYSYTSVFDEESSTIEMLSSCVNPNSILKVKTPRKKYVRTVKSLRVKNKEKNIIGKSLKGKKLTSKCVKMVGKCKSNICKEVECNYDVGSEDSDKRLCDTEVQVDESDFKYIKIEKVSSTRDAETQYEFTESRSDSIEVSFKKDFDSQSEFSNSIFRFDDQSINRKSNNFGSKEQVSVLMLKLPVFVSSPKVEAKDKSSKIKAKVVDVTHGSKRVSIIESPTGTTDSKIRTFAISYDDSFETRLPIENKYHHDVKNFKSDRTVVVAKRDQPSGFPMEISPVKLSTIRTPANAKKAPDAYALSDRVLRKRKAVNYSDPVPPKRTRFTSVESENEFVNHEMSIVLEKNVNNISSGVNKSCCNKQNKMAGSRNSSAVAKVKLTKKILPKKSRRRSTR